MRNWKRQPNGEYQFNVNVGTRIIRVQFPLDATIKDLKESLMWQVYPDMEAYLNSICYISVNGASVSDNMIISKFKYKKFSADISCPMALTRDSKWQVELDYLSFYVLLNNTFEINLKVKHMTPVGNIINILCQRHNLDEIILCANGIPIHPSSHINNIQGQFITAQSLN